MQSVIQFYNNKLFCPEQQSDHQLLFMTNKQRQAKCSKMYTN